MSKRTQMIHARFLRQVETETEKILWGELRNSKLGVRFRRQHPLGPFFLDFYCPSHNLAIELDGFHHLTHDGKQYDTMRTEYLNTKGIHILRFLNSKIKHNKHSVIEKIKHTLKNLE